MDNHSRNSQKYREEILRPSHAPSASCNYSNGGQVTDLAKGSTHHTDICNLKRNLVDINPEKSYSERLDTFTNWPIPASVDPRLIARAGMRYTGNDDRVICDFCKGILYSWEKGDDPLEEHQTHFGNCLFLQGKSWETVDRMLSSQNSTNNTFECNNLEGGAMKSSKLETATKIVKDMGYEDKIIERALKLVNIKDITTATLLDAVFEVENETCPGTESMLTKPKTPTNSSVPAFACCEIASTTKEKKKEKNVLPVCKAAASCSTKTASNSHFTSEEDSLCVASSAGSKKASSSTKDDIITKKSVHNVIPKQKAETSVKEKHWKKQNELLDTVAMDKQKNSVLNCAEKTVKKSQGFSIDLNNNSTKELSPGEKSRISKLKAERQNLWKSIYCNVCNEKKIGMLFLPCRHFIACEECGAELKNCLKCKKEVVATVRIFMT